MTETIATVRAIQLQISERSAWTFAEIETSEGRIGTGECSLNYAPQEPINEKDLVTRTLELGRTMLGIEPRTDLEILSVGLRARIVDAAVKCALDEALFDIEAQRRGTSISRLFSKLPAASVAMYANINRRTRDRSPAGFAESARVAVTAGMKAVKMAPFDHVGSKMGIDEARPHLHVAFERIAAVRDAIGSERRLQVDCHWRLNESMMAEVLNVCAENKLFWLEAPIDETPDRLAEIRSIRLRANAHGILLAGAEMYTGEDIFFPIVDSECYDVVMPDMSYAGGYRIFMRIAERVASKGGHFCPHNAHGPICYAHTVQAGAVAPNFLCMEMQFDETPAFRGILDGNLSLPEKGTIAVPQQAGLGIRLNHEKLIALGAKIETVSETG